MKITGTLVYYFVHCPRQAWLFYNNLVQEHTSEDVKIWKILHELRYEDSDFAEVEFDEWIKLDKINFKKSWEVEVEEFKKSWKELRGQVFQVLFYLWKLEQAWIKAIWKLVFDEKKKPELKQIEDLDFEVEGKKILIPWTKKNKKALEQVLQELEQILSQPVPPPKLLNKSWKPHKKCKGCSYFEFCWV